MSDPFKIDTDDDLIQADDTNLGQQPYTPDDMQDITFDSVTGDMQQQQRQQRPESTTDTKEFTGGPFSLNYYRRYFDLNTSSFFGNCWRSVNPAYKMSSQEFQQVGDMYGAIWITATLIFLLFFCNSFAELLAGDSDKQGVNYFKLLLSSINLLYGYTFIVPIVLWLILRFYFQIVNLIPLTKLISIYGYSGIMWIPAALLSIFRGLLSSHPFLDGCLKWTCILLGMILSGISIFTKINQYLNIIFAGEDPHARKSHVLLLLGALGLAHFGYSIGVKVCFFGNL